MAITMDLTKYIAIILAVLVGNVHAIDFTDFVNDFHSDLAPLLTLFGEKITMQFIGQAMGPLDCLALALAPVGIMTIMVSAIRVGGPTILKAIVGRAKENRAAAELELMSSTSREVCELFNGENIVRCLGSGSVWQYICLLRKGTGNGQVRFMTLQQATKEGLLIERYGKTAKEPRENATSSQGRNDEGEVTGTATGFAPRDRTTLQRMRRRFWKPVSKEIDEEIGLGTIRTAQEPANETDEDPTEQDIASPATLIVIYDAVPEAPNISLNLLHLGGSAWIWLAVMVGVLLQTAVLVFICLISFHPGVQNFFKIDKPLSPYGFGMTFCGTLLLAIGIYLCADVVERSTTEEVYEANDQFGMRLYWLQQDQTVNDQVFQSFATFTDTHCTRFLKSRRAGTSQDDRTPKKLQTETCVGVGFGLVGFVTQFVGFRGLHPAAPLAQLVAIIAMVGLRAYARPGYTENFQTAKLLHGFEQDWFTHQVAQYLTTQQPVPEPTQQPVQEPTQQVAQQVTQGLATQQPAQQLSQSMDNGNKRQCTWSIVTGRDAEYRALRTLREGMGNHALYSEAQRLLVMRGDFYRLVKFRTASSKCAAKLATAMERALGVLFPDGPGGSLVFPDGPSGGLGFRWLLDIDMIGAKQLVWIDLPFHRGGWRVAAEDLHAALSLWMYSARVEEDEKKGPWYVEDEDGTWLCRDVCEPTLKALGEGNYDMRDQVIYDLTNWAPQSYDAVRKIEVIWGREERERNESGRRLEPNCARAARSNPRTQLGLKETETNDSIVELYASEILFSFMWSLAKTLRVRINGEVEVQTRHDASGLGLQEMIQLRSKVVTELINAFRVASCWSERETCLGVISPLSIMDMLPIPQRALNAISMKIQDSLESRDPVKIEGVWKEAFLWARRLMQLCGNRSTTGCVIAWLLEQFHDFQHPEDRAYEIPHLDRTATGPAHRVLSDLIRKGTEALPMWTPLASARIFTGRSMLETFLPHMVNLYKLQGREMRFVFRGAGHSSELPPWFDFTALHEKAARGHTIDSADEFCKLRIFVNVRDICGFTPLLYAAATKNWQLTETLLDMGADPKLADFRGYTAAHHACLSGCLQSLKKLYVKVDITAQAMNGLTPMHLAAGKGNLKIISWLLHNGPPSLRDFDRRTAAHWAAAGGHKRAVRLLGADVNTPDKYGLTPLHLAAMDGNLATIKELLEVGAKANALNHRGETPLGCGIGRAKTEEDASRMTKVMARYLGPNLIDGRRAIDIARNRGFDSVADYLEVQIGTGAGARTSG